MECINCNYFASSEENEHEHCCFNEWGHPYYDIAPCDDDDFDEEFEDDIFDISAEDLREWQDASAGLC